MEKLKADHWRGLDFYKPQQDRNGHVVVVGAGSTGSYAAYCLARIGVPKITVIDFDTVESHNLPNQFFAESMEMTEDIFKVAALQYTIKLMVKNVNLNIIPSRIEDVEANQYLPCTALFVCVDDMDVRKWIFKNSNIQNYANLIVDARTGGLYANIFCYRPKKSTEKNFYEATLHTNAEAAPLPCTGQAVADVAMCVAAEMVSRYRTFAMGKVHPSLHTFYDYNYGQAWIQQVNKYMSGEENGIVTTDENILAVGTGVSIQSTPVTDVPVPAYPTDVDEIHLSAEEEDEEERERER